MTTYPTTATPLRLPFRRGGSRHASPKLSRQAAIGLIGLIAILIAEGFAVSHSPLLAAPLVALLVVALAVDIPIVPFLGAVLLIRVMTDASLSSATTRHSGSLNLSSAIALLFILVASGLLIRRHRGMWTIALSVLALAFWTAIAVRADGASAETVREGVREASILAFGVIVFNARGVVTVPIASRVIQFAGVAPALVAIYQLATHGGMSIAGEMRANGTFYHPDGAAMYFAIAATASLYLYLDNGKRRLDAAFVTLFGAATIATYSITGLGALVVMVLAFGTLRPGSVRLKVGSCAVVTLILAGFFLSPLGAERLASESSSNSHSSLAWRFYKWETLLPGVGKRAPYRPRPWHNDHDHEQCQQLLEGSRATQRIPPLPSGDRCHGSAHHPCGRLVPPHPTLSDATPPRNRRWSNARHRHHSGVSAQRPG